MTTRTSATHRLGRLEQDVAVISHRLADLESQNRTVPTRLIKLEQQFEHLSDQLGELNRGQTKLTSVVSRMGQKITWALAVASTLWALLQLVGPALLRMITP